MFAWIDSIQEAEGVRGDLFEIGVHHGKSAVLLASMAKAEEKLGVCDVFGTQEANVSASGMGDRQIFESNLKKHAMRQTPLTVFPCLSSELNPDRIGTGYRLFHVDGGHNADEAYYDLQLAAKTTVEAGVILVDDAFRLEWPGVIEAILQFLKDYPEFRPLVTGFNKLALVRSACADPYLSRLDNQAERAQRQLGYPWQYKTLPFAGSDIRIFYLLSKHARKPPGLLRMQRKIRSFFGK